MNSSLLSQANLLKVKKGKSSLFSLVCCLLHGLTPLSVQALELPSLTGSYPIGVTEYQLSDSSRNIISSSGTSSPRPIGIQIWYPSKKSVAQQPLSYLEGVSDQILIDNNVPPNLIPALRSIKTRAIPNAARLTAPNSFPVLFFSPGYGGNLPRTHLIQIEELASHGYIIIGIIHVDPDEKITEQVIERALKDRLLDIRYVLETLSKLNNKGKFKDYFDLNNLGILGHSMGGSTASEVLFTNPSFSAGLSMDGSVSKTTASQGLKRPFMLINQNSFYNRDRSQRQVYKRSGESVYSVALKGTAHDSFTDIPSLAYLFPEYDFSDRLSPLFKTKGEANPQRIDPTVTQTTINHYTLAFFNCYLKQQPSEVLNTKPDDSSIIYQFKENKRKPLCIRQ